MHTSYNRSVNISPVQTSGSDLFSEISTQAENIWKCGFVGAIVRNIYYISMALAFSRMLRHGISDVFSLFGENFGFIRGGCCSDYYWILSFLESIIALWI